MSFKRTLAAVLVPVVLASIALTAFVLRPVALQSSLYDLAGRSAEAIPLAVRDHSSRLVPIVVSASGEAQARAAADRLATALPTGSCARVRYRVQGEELSEMLDFCRSHRSGLASPADRKLLETEQGRARIARRAVRRYYSALIPPLFPASEDPFCLADGFVASMPVSYSGWKPVGGVLTAEHEGRTHLLMVLELRADIAASGEALAAFARELDVACAGVRSADVEVAPCGVPLHTARTASRCRREMGALTWFSVLFIAALSLLVFRSWRWIPLLAASLLVAASAGACALWLSFPAIHVMSFVFGTTVLGLVIDYSFHWLLRQGGERRRTMRNLLVSFATTLISLLPLMVSSLPVLRQSAVFLSVGLASSLVYVLLCYPRRPGGDGSADVPASPASCRFAKAGILLVLLLAGFGWCRVRFETDAAAVYRPSEELARNERLFAVLSGVGDDRRGFLVTSGAEDLETLLGREQSLSLAPDTPSLSRFLPPVAVRREVSENVRKLYAEHGAAQSAHLSLGRLAAPPPPEPWRWEDVPSAAAAAFVRDRSLVVPSVLEPSHPLPDGVVFCRPGRVLGDILSEWGRETRVRLLGALALMFAALLFLCRRGAPAAISPSLFAIFSVVGLLGLKGEAVNLFHLLACFLLAGMGVDYAVFLHGSGRKALKPAVCALLTSVAGFGALVFVSLPVVAAFGFVLGVGLPLAFFCALATIPRTEPRTEHGASPVGLETLFLFYRIFGLRALHALSGAVGFCIWMFSRQVRKASPSPRKTMAFARSLADKLVVMACASRLPRVDPEDSPDARQFLSDVAARRGVFVLSSHCGTVEVLAALGECDVRFHAWMEFSRTSVFNRFYLRHQKRGRVVIHPISEFSPATVFEAADALDSGECLVMAGDRGFGRMRKVPFLGGEIMLPQGAFRFARALEHPVYFVACVAVASCRYKAIVRRLPGDDAEAMLSAYASALEEVVRDYRNQWFKWEGA